MMMHYPENICIFAVILCASMGAMCSCVPSQGSRNKWASARL